MLTPLPPGTMPPEQLRAGVRQRLHQDSYRHPGAMVTGLHQGAESVERTDFKHQPCTRAPLYMNKEPAEVGLFQQEAFSAEHLEFCATEGCLCPEEG